MIELLDFGEGNVDLRLAQSAAVGDQLRQPMQGLWSENHVDVRRARDDRRTLLAGHAATHADHQIRIGLLEQAHAAEVVEDALLRLLAHRAGIEENDVGIVGAVGLDDVFGCGEHVGHLVRIVFVHLAPEGADEQFSCHLFPYRERLVSDLRGFLAHFWERGRGEGKRSWPASSADLEKP
jgi:hypothetical protein